MKPTINCHDIVSIRLTDTTEHAYNSIPFAARALILTDKDGDTFRIGLFADTAAQLRVQGDPADTECGVCSAPASYQEPKPEPSQESF